MFLVTFLDKKRKIHFHKNYLCQEIFSFLYPIKYFTVFTYFEELSEAATGGLL